MLGYAMGALTKPVFALAGGVGAVVAARLADRVGEGIRGAPRDALLADITPASIRGAAFGLRNRSTRWAPSPAPCGDGAAAGVGQRHREVLWVAVIPGVLAVLVLLVGIREPQRDRPRGAVNPIRREALARLGRR